LSAGNTEGPATQFNENEKESEYDGRHKISSVSGELADPLSRVTIVAMARSDRDEQLMRALHDQYAASLWSFVVRLTGGDRSRSQDVVQETMLRAWRNPSVLDEEQGSARAWLFTVARRIVVDEWRSARSRRELTVEEPPELVEADQVDAMLDEWIVAEALDRLTPDHREVIVECYYRGRTTAEAAETLHIPAGTVKSRTHYALRALRLAMQEMGVTP
jgi:RNA polymerase sigma-70 factor, ECF subfamily